jgi:hypothetical protein
MNHYDPSHNSPHAGWQMLAKLDLPVGSGLAAGVLENPG